MGNMATRTSASPMPRASTGKRPGLLRQHAPRLGTLSMP
jgi:hypothetical protein